LIEKADVPAFCGGVGVVKFERMERETGIEPATNSLEVYAHIDNKEHMRQCR
jgi:hypothetical protein